MVSVTAAEMSVELTGRNGIITVDAYLDLVSCVVYKEIYLEILNYLHLVCTQVGR
jgi:hypothetical protein